MNLYKKCTEKPCSFLMILVTDTTLASDNPSRFRKDLIERISKLIMTIDDKIKDEKLQYDINREAAKISALSSGKIGKYEFLTGEEILPPDQRRVIEQAKFTYSPSGKAFEKQTLKRKGKKQVEVESTEGLFPKNMRTDKIKNKIHEIKKWEEKLNTKI